MEFSVAPGLLIAMPTLADPNFFRAVVVMCAHNEEGAFGLVINHELEVPVSTVCLESSIDWTGDASAHVYCGGPVERQRGWLLHSSERHFEGSQVIGDGLSITTSQEGLQGYGNEPDGPYRLVLGYAGWGPSQLESEISQGSWITAPLCNRLIFETPQALVWSEALRSVGIDPAHLVDAPTHLN